ncbi:hypothetical protein [Sphaerisporangium fuscum]|uniref:hypothetical protein n=1 Tax=Sphaerisporangium fuscum TaxID=2835868 RepID=UPI001BDD2BD8|nr:hypothetical protein [Sphaerisporangium fuscum]
MNASNTGRSVLRLILAGLGSGLAWFGYLHWTDPHVPGGAGEGEPSPADPFIRPEERW